MRAEPREGLIRTAVTRVAGWFRTEPAAGRRRAADGRVSEQHGGAPQPGANLEPPSAALARASMVTQKMAVLKETLELSPNLKPKIEKEQSLRALLALASEELLFRFSKLAEIGFLGPESAAMLVLFQEQIASVLACKDDARGLDPIEEVERLTKENLALKHKIKALQKHYVQKGVVTERELALEKELESLQNLMRDQHQQLLVARKKGEQLADWQAMVHSLKAKNNLLTSKVDYQGKLLRSFTADQPRQQELVAMMEKLTEQNSQLKRGLAQQHAAFRKLRSGTAGDRIEAAAELIDNSLELHDELEERQSLLDHVKGSAGVEEDLLERIERLTEDNANLLSLYEAGDQLQRCLSAPEGAAGGGIEAITTRIRAQNTRLEETVKERQEQLQFSEETPASAHLFRTCIRLKNEKRELARENRLKEQAVQQEAAEKQLLRKQLRRAETLHRENLQLRGRVQEIERLTKILNQLAKQNELLKKERGELRLKCERATLELTNVNEKMARISREYQALIAEYEKLFGEQ